jgi:hypothetical protein
VGVVEALVFGVGEQFFEGLDLFLLFAAVYA